MIQQPADQTVETNHPPRGGRGRTGVPAPESGEHTLSEGTVPNHDRGINTVKRVASASGRALHRLAGVPPPTPARTGGQGKGVGTFIRPVAAPVRLCQAGGAAAGEPPTMGVGEPTLPGCQACIGN